MSAIKEALKDIEFSQSNRNEELIKSFQRERGFRTNSIQYKHKDGTEVAIAGCNVPAANGGMGLDIAIIKNEQYLRISSDTNNNKTIVSMNEFGSDKKQEISLPLEKGGYSVKGIAASLSSMPQLQETLNKYVPVEYEDMMNSRELRAMQRESKNNAAFMNAFNNFSKGGR